MTLDDGLLLPVFEPSVARNLDIMLVDVAIVLRPVIELALAQADPLNKHDIGQSMYYRWRQKRDPEKVGIDRRCRELELEVDQLKKLVAELLVDRTMLQNVAKKVVSPDQQCAAADYLCERYGISQRRICRVLGKPRSVLQYRRRRQADERALNREIKGLARRHTRFGYRIIYACFLRRGWTINIKRVRKLWIQLGLKRSVRLRKARKSSPKPGTSVNRCVNQPTMFKNDV